MLSDKLGPTQTHHTSYLVRTSELDTAVSMFLEMRWLEAVDRAVSGDWGKARFVHAPYQTMLVQLTEYSDRPVSLQTCSDSQHLAIAVQHVSAETAANEFLNWAKAHGLGEEAYIEKANVDGTKWFVHLPALLTFALEVVEVTDFRSV